MAADDIASGDVSISAYNPLSNNEFPKMTHLNTSAWELWFFDAVSSTDDAAITLSFFRDGSGTRMGKGSLRTQVHVVWPDGETFGTEVDAGESVIEACPGDVIKASWHGKDGGSTSFEVSQNLKEATVRLDLPAMQGDLTLSSVAPAFPNDGDTDPSTNISPILAPTIHWLQPIPIASVSVSVTISGKELSFTGTGGHDRFWTPYSWMTLMDESYYMRTVAGPFTLVLLRIISRVNPGRTYVSAYLFEEGRRVFASQNDNISLEDDYVSFKLSHLGNVRGDYKDTNTGYVVDLVAPAKGKHWRFELEHQSIWWNHPTGPVTGNTGFIDKVTGGECGGERHEGAGSSGQCQLPPSAK